MKIGDNLIINKKIKYHVGYERGINDINITGESPYFIGKDWYYILDIKKDLVYFDRKNYTENNPYVTTIQELERIGVYTKTKIKTMTYKIGDTFKLNKNHTILASITNDPKDWGERTIEKDTYTIHKITKTQVYFDFARNNTNNWFIVKIPVFEKMINSKKVIGYKLLKDTPIAKAGTLVDLKGYYKSDVIFEDGMNDCGFPISKLSDTEWFSPIYEDEYKVGDYVVFTADYLPGITSTWTKNRIGEVLKIKKIETDGISFEEGGGNYFENIRRATPEEIEKKTSFKEGDWVIVTNIDTYSYGQSVGETKPIKGQIYKITNLFSPTKKEYIYLDVNTGKIALKPSGVRRATLEEIEKAKSIMIGEFHAEITKNTVKFGCQTLTLQDVLTVKHLLSSPISASIKIKETNITNELIDKILNQMNG